MGTGVTLSTQPPENLFKSQISNLKFEIRNNKKEISFGSGDLAVVRVNILIAGAAKTGQSPRYGTLLI